MSEDEQTQDLMEISRLMKKHGWDSVHHYMGQPDLPPYFVPSKKAHGELPPLEEAPSLPENLA